MEVPANSNKRLYIKESGGLSTSISSYRDMFALKYVKNLLYSDTKALKFDNVPLSGPILLTISIDCNIIASSVSEPSASNEEKKTCRDAFIKYAALIQGLSTAFIYLCSIASTKNSLN